MLKGGRMYGTRIQNTGSTEVPRWKEQKQTSKSRRHQQSERQHHQEPGGGRRKGRSGRSTSEEFLFDDTISDVTGGSSEHTLLSGASSGSNSSSSHVSVYEEDEDSDDSSDPLHDTGDGILPGWEDAGVQAKRNGARHNKQSVHIHSNGSIRVDSLSGNGGGGGGGGGGSGGGRTTAATRVPTKRVIKTNGRRSAADEIVHSVQKRVEEEKNRVMKGYRQNKQRKQQKQQSSIEGMTDAALRANYQNNVALPRQTNVRSMRNTHAKGKKMNIQGRTTKKNQQIQNERPQRQNLNHRKQMQQQQQSANNFNNESPPRRVQVHTDGTVEIEFNGTTKTNGKIPVTKISPPSSPQPSTLVTQTTATPTAAAAAAAVPLHQPQTVSTSNGSMGAPIAISSERMGGSAGVSGASSPPSIHTLKEELMREREIQSQSLKEFWKIRKDNLKLTDQLLYGRIRAGNSTPLSSHSNDAPYTNLIESAFFFFFFFFFFYIFLNVFVYMYIFQVTLMVVMAEEQTGIVLVE
jgi:hypothetical protein